MVDGKQRDDWVHTAVLLTKLHNVNAQSKSQAQSFDDNYPFVERRVVNKLESLKDLWLSASNNGGTTGERHGD